LLTAQRVGEISGMRVDELDLARGVWSIPGSRTKNKHAHAVSLSQPAVAVIEEALAEAGRGAQFVFPSNGASLPPMAVAKAIARAQPRFGLPAWTAHDLRRTALTAMSRLGVPPITLAHIANHRTGTKAGMTLSVYVHDDHSEQKAAALALWADRLAAIVGEKSAADVVPIGRAR
jgi:integrase